jgi:hypothetical protein
VAPSRGCHVRVLGRPSGVGNAHQDGHSRVPQLVTACRHGAVGPPIGQLEVRGEDEVTHDQACRVAEGRFELLNDGRVGYFVEVADHDQIHRLHTVQSSPDAGTLKPLEVPRRGAVRHIVDDNVSDLRAVTSEPSRAFREAGRFGLPGMRPGGLDQYEVVDDRVEEAQPEVEQRKLVVECEAVPNMWSVLCCNWCVHYSTFSSHTSRQYG